MRSITWIVAVRGALKYMPLRMSSLSKVTIRTGAVVSTTKLSSTTLEACPTESVREALTRQSASSLASRVATHRVRVVPSSAVEVWGLKSWALSWALGEPDSSRYAAAMAMPGSYWRSRSKLDSSTVTVATRPWL